MWVRMWIFEEPCSLLGICLCGHFPARTVQTAADTYVAINHVPSPRQVPSVH